MIFALFASLALAQAPAEGGPPQALTQGAIMQVIDSHRMDLARCNEQHAGDRVNDLVIHFKIRRDGSTTEVKTRGGHNRPLTGCVESVIRHAQFGEYAGRPMPPVNFPISFGPVASRPRATKSRAPTKRDVAAAVTAHKADFTRCGVEHPGGRGSKVVFHFRVEPDGSPSDVHRQGGDLDDNPALVDCLGQLVTGLRFAPYDAVKPAEFDFPFSR